MRPLMLVAMVSLVLVSAKSASAVQPSPAGYNQDGTIVVTPPNPEAGDFVNVAVTGCQPAPGEVPVYIDGIYVGDAQVGPDGSFSQDFQVPDVPPGPVMVEVRCSNEVLGSMIEVQAAQPPGGGQLPQTGTSSTGPLVQFGAGLLGVGVLLILLADRRNTDRTNPYHARHAAVNV